MKLLIMQSSPVSRYILPFGSKYSHQCPVTNIQLFFSQNMSWFRLKLIDQEIQKARRLKSKKFTQCIIIIRIPQEFGCRNLLIVGNLPILSQPFVAWFGHRKMA